MSHAEQINAGFVRTAEAIKALGNPGDIADGSTLGLEQLLLANDGQPGLTVRVVGPTTNGKVQCISLGKGNVVRAYASGADFSAGIVKEQEFMSLGEPICFTGLEFGAIITATGGIDGFTEIEGASAAAAYQGIMPLMSYGLAFDEAFLYAFRNSTGNSNDRGIIFLVNGPLSSEKKLTDGSGVTVRGQEGIQLAPWEKTYFDTDGNQEYIIKGVKRCMGVILSRGGGTAVDGPVRSDAGVDPATLATGRQWDCRLILPPSNDIIGNSRSGWLSAPYANTRVPWYTRQGAKGVVTASPGSPVNISTEIGSLGDHNPAGYVRMPAEGLVTAHSGADGQGGDAVQFAAVSSLSQVVAQPLYIPDSGLGDEAGLTVFGPYTGTAWVYEWDDALKTILLKYTLNVTRDPSIVVSTQEDQLHPCAASLSNSTGNANNTTLNGALLPGVVIADVPIGLVIQAQNGQTTMRSQRGTTVTSIYTQEDETMMHGWTPPRLRAVIREALDGLLYKRVLAAGGVESWSLA